MRIENLAGAVGGLVGLVGLVGRVGRGGSRWFVRIFFVVLDFFCIFVAWYFVYIPYFVLKLK